MPILLFILFATIGYVAGLHFYWYIELAFMVLTFLIMGKANGGGLESIPILIFAISMVYICIGMLLGDIAYYVQTTSTNFDISLSDVFVVQPKD